MRPTAATFARASALASRARGTLSAPRETRALAALIALSATLRFATLGIQSLDSDEAFTADIARASFGGALSQIPQTESTPPLYYVAVWLWSRLFGTSEIALRSLSALAGTAAVAVIYAIGTTLHSRRAGLVAAAFATVSPLLVWYSQEARAYMLFMLLSAISFWAFARALREPRWLIAWALASAAALATHYYAAVTVVPEAIWLLRCAPRRRTAAAVAAVAAAAAALAPLAAHQSAHVSRPWAQALSAKDQVTGTGQSFLVGIQWTWLIHRPGVLVLAGVALGLALLALRHERRALALPAAVVAFGLSVPFALSLVGPKYFTPGNELGVWPPLAAALAIGAATRRAGLLLAAAGCAAMLAITLAGPLDEDLQREDWRALIGRLNDEPGARAVLLLDPFQHERVVRYYREGGDAGRRAREIVVVGRWPSPPATGFPAPRPGMRQVGVAKEGEIAYVRFVAPVPVPVPPAR